MMAAASLTAPAAITRKLQQCCCAAAAAARLRRWCLHAHPQQHQRLSSTRAAASPSSRESGRQETASQQVQCYVSQPVTDAASVPVPLCRRPGQFAEQLSALLQWRQTVLEEISSLKDAFEAADVGPAASELQREVTWALDDGIAAWREVEEQQWQPCTWQQLDMELAAAARHKRPTQAWQVLLRAPVSDLQQLWQLRLKDRVPFQYLICTAHWRDLILSVGPGVLVPRPETELMIDLAAAALAANPGLARMPWADLGTGSGALAIGTAQLLMQQQQKGQQPSSDAAVTAKSPAAGPPQVFAVDLSTTAVAYAATNAAAHGVQETVQALQGSWFDPLQHLQGQLGGVLSNPPYIPRRQMEAGLQAEVAQHEPMSALDGGPGAGMDSLQAICEKAVTMLAPGGFLVLETAGAEQAPLVQRLLQRLHVPLDSECLNVQAAFMDVVVHDDCYGVPRFVTATRASATAPAANGGGGGGVQAV